MLNRCLPSCLCHTSFKTTSDPRSALNTPQVDTADPLIDCAATYAEAKHAQNNAFGCATVVTLASRPPANKVRVPDARKAATAIFLHFILKNYWHFKERCAERGIFSYNPCQDGRAPEEEFAVATSRVMGGSRRGARRVLEAYWWRLGLMRVRWARRRILPALLHIGTGRGLGGR